MGFLFLFAALIRFFLCGSVGFLLCFVLDMLFLIGNVYEVRNFSIKFLYFFLESFFNFCLLVDKQDDIPKKKKKGFLR